MCYPSTGLPGQAGPVQRVTLIIAVLNSHPVFNFPFQKQAQRAALFQPPLSLSVALLSPGRLSRAQWGRVSLGFFVRKMRIDHFWESGCVFYSEASIIHSCLIDERCRVTSAAGVKQPKSSSAEEVHAL